jgi:hypothetical protein
MIRMRGSHVLVVIALLAVPATATADVIVTTSTFTIGTPSDFFALAPFDASLGTLDSVAVSISGTSTLQVTANTFFNPLVTPYTVQAGFTQQFEGVGSQFFDFITPATMHFAPFVTVGGTLTFVTPFNYGFTFTDVSDFVGFVIPSFSGVTSPPTSVAATRSDFLDTVPGANLLQLTQAPTVIQVFGAPAGLATFLSLESAGSVQVTHTYTPAAVPEPAVGVLVSLAGIAWLRRRT